MVAFWGNYWDITGMPHNCPLKDLNPFTRPEMVAGLHIEYSKGLPGSEYEEDGAPAYYLRCKLCGKNFVAGVDTNGAAYRFSYPKCLSPQLAPNQQLEPGKSS